MTTTNELADHAKLARHVRIISQYEGITEGQASVLRAAAKALVAVPAPDPREVAHIECDCVPDLGPSHCHLCGERAGQVIAWSEAHPAPTEADREMLRERIIEAMLLDSFSADRVERMLERPQNPQTHKAARLADAILSLIPVPTPTEAVWRKAIADQVRRNCTLDWETVKKGGDALIYAVCDWIENPPEWSTFTPPVPPQSCQECEGAGARIFDSGGTERDRVTCATCGSHPPVSPEGGE